MSFCISPILSNFSLFIIFILQLLKIAGGGDGQIFYDLGTTFTHHISLHWECDI